MSESKILKGTIVQLIGHFMSGLATLVVDQEIEPGGPRVRSSVFCDNAPTVRTLDRAFGGFIGEGHTFLNEVIEGKEIYYTVDGFGILEGFTPVEEAPPEMVRIYEQQGGEL